MLQLLDDHLAELAALRHVLAAARPVHMGERLSAATETVRSAERYALAVGALLDPQPASVAR
ncbi:hypothetical protein AB0M46_07820 [Dactylosporangium sp. NPDC051485]|uniref:hypothetical protein n=1 Tax=Dactylosporangium sp. NPDC051485 TaxID=3154846 RepID=UPI00342958C9